MIQSWINQLQNGQNLLMLIGGVLTILAGALLGFRVVLGRILKLYHFFTERRLEQFSSAIQALEQRNSTASPEYRLYNEAWQQEQFLLATGIRAAAPLREKLCEFAVTINMPLKELAVICRSKELKLNGEQIEATPDIWALTIGVINNLLFDIPLVLFVLLFLLAEPSGEKGVWVALQLFTLKLLVGFFSGAVIGLSLRSVIRPFILARRVKKMLGVATAI